MVRRDGTLHFRSAQCPTNLEVIHMQAIQTQELELASFSQRSNQENVVRAAWPVYRDTGAANTAVVYVELDPGMELPTHTDSAEEVLIVLEGEIDATIDGERGRLGAGGIAIVPAMAPHGARNVGDGIARLAGVFSSNTIVAVFDDEFEGIGTRVVSTPPPAELAQAAPAGA
jgi:quercetin dioxygenase-like cupin family protein